MTFSQGSVPVAVAARVYGKDPWHKAGLVIPIIWSPFAEEEKCYVVTDKTFVKNARVNMRSIFGLPGWNKRNIPIKKEEE